MIAKCKHFIFQTFIFKLLFIFITNECDRSTPIKLQDGSCELTFCTTQEYLEGQCVIDNEIVKTQYLNDIINLDSTHDNTKFDLIKYSNGNLVSISLCENNQTDIVFWEKNLINGEYKIYKKQS